MTPQTPWSPSRTRLWPRTTDWIRSSTFDSCGFSRPALSSAWPRSTRRGAPAEALDGADLIMVCVGPPLDAGGLADMRQVQAACAAIREHAPQTPVVIRSTLPPGISAALMAWLGAQTADRLGPNPGFPRQGTAV